MSARSAEATDFDVRYRADPDPWGYESSAYEHMKYRRTLAALPLQPVGDALELGCSNGVFTAMLAPRCESLLAVDFSAEAVCLAQRRLAEHPDVTVEQRDLRDGLPDGRFDLIVCSELLYYWEREQVLDFCHGATAILRPGGSMVAVHWRGDDPRAPLSGPAVHGILDEHLGEGFEIVLSEHQPGYLLDRWERVAEP